MIDDTTNECNSILIEILVVKTIIILVLMYVIFINTSVVTEDK
jgi:hypothetical protein